MSRYAVITNGKVENIVVSESDFAAAQGWVAANDFVKIGDLYTNNAFIRTLVDRDNIVSPIEFKLLFDINEIVAIRAKAATDAVIKELFNIIDDPRLTKIDLNLNFVANSLDYLVSKNLITSIRKIEILSGISK